MQGIFPCADSDVGSGKTTGPSIIEPPRNFTPPWHTFLPPPRTLARNRT